MTAAVTEEVTVAVATVVVVTVVAREEAVMAVATHRGDWHWKWTPLDAYSMARPFVKFSTKPLVEA